MKKKLFYILLGVLIIAACTAKPPTGPTGGNNPPSATRSFNFPRSTATSTWTPIPDDTATPVPPPSATPTLTKGAIREQFLEGMAQVVKEVPGVASVDLVIALSDGVAITLSTDTDLSYQQPPISWAVIQALAQKYGSQKKDDLMATLGTTDVTIYLTTTSSKGIDRYGSTTAWDTLVGVAKHQLNYDNWAAQSSASFKY